MITFFTTTKRLLYKRDLLNVCCLEEDALVRFGYRKKYISQSLTPRRGKRIRADAKGVVVFCDWKGEASEPMTYYPLRQVKIVDVAEDSFGSFAITLSMGGLFDYGFSGLSSRIKEIQVQISRFAERPNTTADERNKARSQKYVTEEGEWPPDWFAGEWEALVGQIGQLHDFKTSAFFRLARSPAFAEAQASASSLSPFPTPSWNKQFCRAHFTLKADEQYALSLKILSAEASDLREPTCSMTGEVATILGPFIRQSSEGVEADFLLRTKPVLKDDRAMLLVRFPPTEQEKIASSEIHGVVTIKASRTIFWMAIGSLVLGGFLQGSGGDIKDWVQSFSSETSSWPTAALWISKAVGAGFMAVGGYLGFRKLPLKG